MDNLAKLGAAVGVIMAARTLYQHWLNERVARQSMETIFTGFVLHPTTGLVQPARMDFTEAQLRFLITELHTMLNGHFYHVEVTRTDLPGTDRYRVRAFVYSTRAGSFAHR